MDVHALGNLGHWLWSRGKWFLLLLSILYIIAWIQLGWSDAWETLVGRRTPKNASYPLTSWLLSVVGWVAVPALIGAIAGYLITSEADKRRSSSLAGIRERYRKGKLAAIAARRRIWRVPRAERTLDVLAMGPLKACFVDPFIAVHGDPPENAVQADTCWRQCVNDLLEGAQEADGIPRRHVRSWAEESAVAMLRDTATLDDAPYCIVCGRGRLQVQRADRSTARRLAAFGRRLGVRQREAK